MTALDKLKQEQQALETSTALMLRLDAVEEQTRELTKAVNAVSGFLRAMDEAQIAALKRVEKSISQRHEQPLQTQLDDETKSRLSEIEKTLDVVAKELSASGAVKLPDGSIVKRSDVDAYSIMQSLQSRLETTTTALGELKHVVGNVRTVRVDVDRLSDYTVRLLDKRLSQAVEAPVKRIESTLEGFEHRVSSLGADKVSEVAQRLDQTLTKAEGVVAHCEPHRTASRGPGEASNVDGTGKALSCPCADGSGDPSDRRAHDECVLRPRLWPAPRVGVDVVRGGEYLVSEGLDRAGDARRGRWVHLDRLAGREATQCRVRIMVRGGDNDGNQANSLRTQDRQTSRQGRSLSVDQQER